eukprot:gene2544-28808_t
MRLKALEDHAKMESLSEQLDFSRKLELLKLGSKGKISKRSKVHVFLFTDTLLYAKSTGGGGGGGGSGKHKHKHKHKYVVYKQVHRSLIQATTCTAPFAMPNSVPRSQSASSAKGGYPGDDSAEADSAAIELVLFGIDGSPTNLLLMCKSPTEKNRWLSVLDPVEEDDDHNDADGNSGSGSEGGKFQEQPDELTLKRGDILNIITRGGPDDMSKGVLIRVAQATTRETRGWFPTSCFKEIQFTSSKARRVVEAPGSLLKQFTSSKARRVVEAPGSLLKSNLQAQRPEESLKPLDLY